MTFNRGSKQALIQQELFVAGKNAPEVHRGKLIRILAFEDEQD